MSRLAVRHGEAYEMAMQGDSPTRDGGGYVTVHEMPSDEQPRERLELYGASTFKSEELLAILLRVGRHGENAIALSQRILRDYQGPSGLLRADFAQLCAERGPGF